MTLNTCMQSGQVRSRGVLFEGVSGRVGDEFTPDGYADGSHSKSGSQPVTAPEPTKVPDSSRQPLAKEGEPAVPTTSAQPEALANLLEVL